MSGTKSSPEKALKWLLEHGGDGCFDKNGVVLAQGESGPFMRSTWNQLRDNGIVQYYGGKRDGGTGHGRVKIVS